MRSNNNIYSILFPDEIAEIVYIWTRRIPNNQSGGKVDNLCSILLHFLWSVFNISSRVTTAASEPNELYFLPLINTERSLPVAESPQAFTSSTGTVAVTDDDSNFGFIVHPIPPVKPNHS